MTPSATTEPGRRERKKQQTRQLIADTARELFVERGFEEVTVAEIARAADVAETTVFNYFPTKEDLVYWRMESFEAALLGAIRDRDPGESVVAAFRRFALEPRGLLAERDPQAREELAAITRMIASSPALRAREQQVYARYTESLATLLAEEAGGTIEPWVAANAMMGVHRALVDYTRERVIAGERSPRLARDVRAQGERALALLESGLGGYAVRARAAGS
jgi:AcrR family transcriptional regulator